MAFMLPLAIGGASSLGGFVMGYMYNYPADTETLNPAEPITETDLMKLKLQSPHKELKAELQNFKKNSLRRTTVSSHVQTDGEKMMNEMRQKILNRRLSLNPPE
jgi:hypothetical protein